MGTTEAVVTTTMTTTMLPDDTAGMVVGFLTGLLPSLSEEVAGCPGDAAAARKSMEQAMHDLESGDAADSLADFMQAAQDLVPFKKDCVAVAKQLRVLTTSVLHTPPIQARANAHAHEAEIAKASLRAAQCRKSGDFECVGDQFGQVLHFIITGDNVTTTMLPENTTMAPTSSPTTAAVLTTTLPQNNTTAFVV